MICLARFFRRFSLCINFKFAADFPRLLRWFFRRVLYLHVCGRVLINFHIDLTTFWHTVMEKGCSDMGVLT